jgi:ribosome-associated protein
MLRISPNIQIPHHEIRFRFARAAGPGGQNVNKVSSKAILVWPIDASPSVPEQVKQRIRQDWKSRINKSGELILTSQRHRDQPRNVADCLNKLRAILLAAAKPPKKRIATKRTRASKRRRLDAKKRTSRRKQLRREPTGE